jgi:hypothetical protein
MLWSLTPLSGDSKPSLAFFDLSKLFFWQNSLPKTEKNNWEFTNS